ncbi:hypothetical protein TSUD_247220 [Trifolium subterraneum]|uniref:DUF7054 domain-containing protein n=1 Tax=Trifolium subterraneum TaxID=3900 RepID=A0A2Z6P4F6_TRISU|nr:hypothetical protein TSUD_247220 [Trifolium subterraneum]
MAKKLHMVEKVELDKSLSWSIRDEVKNKKKKKNNNNNNINKILISINIVGSSGPLTIVVKEDDVVCDVIDKALKSYARQERLPILGSDITNFAIYPLNDVSEALSPSVTIGSFGTWKFVLCEKQPSPTKTQERSKIMAQKGSGSWKSFSFKKVRSALDCVATAGRA